jgi:hypothetical protein
VYIVPVVAVGFVVGFAVGLGVGVDVDAGVGVTVAVGVAVGPRVGLPTTVADALAPGVADWPPPAGPSLATRSAPTAAIIATARTTWPIPFRSARCGIGKGGRPRSMTTGAVRATGRSGMSGTAAR